MKRLLLPGELSEWMAFALAIAMLLLIAAVDIADGKDIRLHNLYIFPIAMVGLQAPSVRTVLLAIASAFALQTITLLGYHDAPVTLISSLAVALTESALTAVMARSIYTNHVKLERLATRDALTGLLNRRKFDYLLNAEIARQKRYGGIFSVAVIDLDHFKKLNDSHGHLTGDQALVEVARVLATHCRETDHVARLGGDEFAILLPNTALVDCSKLCDGLAAEIPTALTLAGFSITASIGHSTCAMPPISATSAIHEADRAMYQAKTQGRARAVGSLALRPKL